MRRWIAAAVIAGFSLTLLCAQDALPTAQKGADKAADAKQKQKAKGKAKGKGKQREPLVIPEVARDKVICFCLYTVHEKTLKLSAQLYPLKDGEERTVSLEI